MRHSSTYSSSGRENLKLSIFLYKLSEYYPNCCQYFLSSVLFLPFEHSSYKCERYLYRSVVCTFANGLSTGRRQTPPNILTYPYTNFVLYSSPFAVFLLPYFFFRTSSSVFLYPYFFYLTFSTLLFLPYFSLFIFLRTLIREQGLCSG